MGIFSDSEVRDEAEAAVMASEEIENQIDSLKKSLNALDKAVQHHDEEIDRMTDILTQEFDTVSDHVEDNRKTLFNLKDLFRKFSSIQSTYIENVDVLDSEISENKRNLSKLEAKMKKIEKRQRGIEERMEILESDIKSRLINFRDSIKEDIEGLEDRVNDIENEFILDTNRQEWDLESKADSSEFEDYKEKTEKELSKLRTSINDLSDKIEPEEVEVEEKD